jgi:enoyl-[acyl-carrier protein] reductase III
MIDRSASDADFAAGKVALITGSSRGIGRELALRLARGGASIVVNYKKNADLAEQVRAQILDHGGDAIAVAADMEETADIDRLFDAAGERYGRLDFFVANAAASSFKNVLDLSAHHLDRTYAMNVRSFVLGAQRAVRLMDHGGRVVALSSYGAMQAYPTYANLGAAKAAIEAWVRYMAVEFADRAINVNAVNGGLIESDSLRLFLWCARYGADRERAGEDPKGARRNHAGDRRHGRVPSVAGRRIHHRADRGRRWRSVDRESAVHP